MTIHLPTVFSTLENLSISKESVELFRELVRMKQFTLEHEARFAQMERDHAYRMEKISQKAGVAMARIQREAEDSSAHHREVMAKLAIQARQLRKDNELQLALVHRLVDPETSMEEKHSLALLLRVMVSQGSSSGATAPEPE